MLQQRYAERRWQYKKAACKVHESVSGSYLCNSIKPLSYITRKMLGKVALARQPFVAADSMAAKPHVSKTRTCARKARCAATNSQSAQIDDAKHAMYNAVGSVALAATLLLSGKPAPPLPSQSHSTSIQHTNEDFFNEHLLFGIRSSVNVRCCRPCPRAFRGRQPPRAPP